MAGLPKRDQTDLAPVRLKALARVISPQLRRELPSGLVTAHARLAGSAEQERGPAEFASLIARAGSMAICCRPRRRNRGRPCRGRANMGVALARMGYSAECCEKPSEGNHVA
jgi:hypothetical protein